MPIITYPDPWAAMGGYSGYLQRLQAELLLRGIQYPQVRLPSQPPRGQLPLCPPFAPQQQPVSIPELSADAWDNVALSVYSSASGVTVRFLGEYQLANGSVQHFSRDVVPTSDRAVTSAVVELPVSKLLSMTAILAAGSAQRGQVYVRAQAQKAVDSAATRVATLLAGYVSNTFAPAWPGGTIEDTLSGYGYHRSFTGTDPAAGEEVTETVPTGAIWRLKVLRLQFVASATAATREVQLTTTDGTICLYCAGSGINHTANQTKFYTFADSGMRWDATQGANTVVPYASTLLYPGSIISTNTVLIQAGDNYSNVHVQVEEWVTA